MNVLSKDEQISTGRQSGTYRSRSVSQPPYRYHLRKLKLRKYKNNDLNIKKTCDNFKKSQIIAVITVVVVVVVVTVAAAAAAAVDATRCSNSS